MLMFATVKEIMQDDLLVCDHATSQDVVVHTTRAVCFCPGDSVRICYNGIMTNSLPPQITARRICRIRSCNCGCR